MPEQRGHGSCPCLCSVGVGGWVFGTPAIPPARNVVWAEGPHLLQASLTVSKMNANIISECCHLGARHSSCPLLPAGISLAGELKGLVPLGGLKRDPSCPAGFQQRTESPVHSRHSTLNFGSFHLN